MWILSHLLFTVLLASAAQGTPKEPSAVDSGDIPLGVVQFETLALADDHYHWKHSPFIVVRATNRRTKTESFGLSDEIGRLLMPLPPGEYRWDAFSQDGKRLRLVRPVSERDFPVKKAEVIEVGVELKDAPPK
jgi:hypothetical protein